MSGIGRLRVQALTVGGPAATVRATTCRVFRAPLAGGRVQAEVSEIDEDYKVGGRRLEVAGRPPDHWGI